MPRSPKPYVCPNAVVQLAMLVACCNVSISLAEAGKTDAAVPLTVRLYNYAAVPAGVLATAENETVRILRQSGIQLSWVPCAVSDRDFENTPSNLPPARGLRMLPS